MVVRSIAGFVAAVYLDDVVDILYWNFGFDIARLQIFRGFLVDALTFDRNVVIMDHSSSLNHSRN